MAAIARIITTAIVMSVTGTAHADTICIIDRNLDKPIVLAEKVDELFLQQRQLAQCDRSGFEPWDLLAARTGPHPVTMLAGRLARLRFEQTTRPITIEWLSWSNEGVTPVAERTFNNVPRELAIPIANAPRLVRVLRPGNSPVTFVASPDRQQFDVPRAAEGGEIGIRFSKRPSLPIGVLLQREGRNRPVRLPTQAGWLWANSLRPGTYTVTPIFRGEIPGESKALRVEQGKSALQVPWILEPSGSATVRVSPGACASPQALALEHLGSGASFIVQEGPAKCLFMAEGLPPGPYRFSYDGLRRIETSRSVASNGLLTLVLDPNDVTVRGTVHDGWRNGSSLEIAFVLLEDGRTFTTHTDSEGHFEQSLPQSGKYGVTVRSSAHHAVPQGVHEFAEGLNELVLELPGTVVHIEVDAATAERGVLLAIRGPTSVSAPVAKEDFSDTSIVGLPFGDYSVTASAGELTTQFATRFSLSEANPEVFVTVVLNRTRGTLHIVDAQGNAVTAGVTVGKVLTATAPGTYSLDGIRPESEIRIDHPGFLPACRQRGAEPEVVVVLGNPAATTTRVRLRPSVRAVGGWVRGLPGSTCAVPLSSLPWHFIPAGGNETAFEIAGLPPGSYEITVQRRVTALVPGPDVIIEWASE